MSTWTHVAAVIRFDGLQSLGMAIPDLGNTVSYEDEKDKWDKCTVPCGSEGSLITTLWSNPSKNSIAAWTATIFGDLRDYEDIEEITAYLKRITDGKHVRNGVATIEVEGQSSVVLHWNEDKWVKVSETTTA